jgi:hypothetical protein
MDEPANERLMMVARAVVLKDMGGFLFVVARTAEAAA